MTKCEAAACLLIILTLERPPSPPRYRPKAPSVSLKLLPNRKCFFVSYFTLIIFISSMTYYFYFQQVTFFQMRSDIVIPKLENIKQFIKGGKKEPVKTTSTTKNNNNNNITSRYVKRLNEFRGHVDEKFEKLIKSGKEGFMKIEKKLDVLIASRNCKRQNNVVFLKTHKTGSSTVTSILNRFADINNLTMLLPRKESNRFGWPTKFSGASVEQSYLLKGERANVLSNHARFQKTAMKSFMQPHSKFITILRHPETLLNSVFYYWSFDTDLQKFGFPKPTNYSVNLTGIDEFFKDPLRYYKAALKTSVTSLLRNGMLFDLGFDIQKAENVSDDTARTMIKQVDRDFDLVLITEHFDESLVVMKREFCWSFEDILYVKHNARKTNEKELQTQTADRIAEWARLDLLLYEHFNQTLWNKIRSYGDGFWKDLDEFRSRLKEVYTNCDLVTYNAKAHLSTIGIEKFRMGPNVDQQHRPFCQKLFYTEVDYITQFRKMYELKIKSRTK